MLSTMYPGGSGIRQPEERTFCSLLKNGKKILPKGVSILLKNNIIWKILVSIIHTTRLRLVDESTRLSTIADCVILGPMIHFTRGVSIL